MSCGENKCVLLPWELYGVFHVALSRLIEIVCTGICRCMLFNSSQVLSY